MTALRNQGCHICDHLAEQVNHLQLLVGRNDGVVVPTREFAERVDEAALVQFSLSSAHGNFEIVAGL